ncbi:MAG: hypothetical protein ACP5NW_02075 [Candidatus Woesearchaeota archaeon]
MNKKDDTKWVELVISIVVDGIGMISYAFPILGELSDIIWAPISMIITGMLHKNVWFITFNGVEEVLPFTDMIPTVTMNWFYYHYIQKGE